MLSVNILNLLYLISIGMIVFIQMIRNFLWLLAFSKFVFKNISVLFRSALSSSSAGFLRPHSTAASRLRRWSSKTKKKNWRKLFRSSKESRRWPASSFATTNNRPSWLRSSWRIIFRRFTPFTKGSVLWRQTGNVFTCSFSASFEPDGSWH